MKLNEHTYADIMALKPCYDPVKRGYIGADWKGTALDVLLLDDVPTEDRLWCALRDDWIPGRTLHEFAIWCAEEALKLVDTPDPRSVAALEVKRKWLDGQATNEELAAAEAARAAAAGDAAEAAVGAARAAAAGAARAAAAGAARAAAADAQRAHLVEMLKEG
jgi:hypothetical protein